MGYANESGYTPLTVEALMEIVRGNFNTQFGTSYTTETFLGTDAYKYYYGLIQRLQQNEVKTSEIFNKIQDYFRTTNQLISRPIVTNPGIIDKFKTEGYTASVKKIDNTDRGKLFVCIDVKDDHSRGQVEITSYANLVSGTDDTIQVGATVFTAQAGAATLGTATFQAATSNTATATSLAAQINAHATAGALVLATSVGAIVYLRAIDRGVDGNTIDLIYTDNDTNIGATVSGATLLGGYDSDGDDYDDIRSTLCHLIRDTCVGGVVSQGDEVEAIVLSNGQSFDFRFALPNRIPILLRLTIALSENNMVVVGTPTATKTALLANINARYALGKNFEPQRYFSVIDAPWAASVLLEWSDDNGMNWNDDVYDAAFDDIFEVGLGDITLVET